MKISCSILQGYLYTQPSLIRSPPSTGHLSGDVAMVNMVLTCTEKHMLGHMRVGACTCMCFTLHCELRAYPSYGHPPRRRCPDKGGLSGARKRLNAPITRIEHCKPARLLKTQIMKMSQFYQVPRKKKQKC